MEPQLNFLIHFGHQVPVGKWTYLFLPERGDLYPGSQPAKLLGFNQEGNLFVEQPATEQLLKAVGVISFIAKVDRSGRSFEVASNNRILAGDRISFAGQDGLDTAALHNPQLYLPVVAAFYLYRFHSPADRSAIYRSVWLGGDRDYQIEISRGGGEHWEPINVSIDGAPVKPKLMGFVYLHPTDPKTFFVRVDFTLPGRSTGEENLAVTHDQGKTFSIVDTMYHYSYFEISAANPNVWYRIDKDGYIFRSDDGGKHFLNKISDAAMLAPVCFSRGRLLTFRAQYLAIHPKNANLVLVSSSKGLLRTTDSGKTWKIINVGIPSALQMNQVAFDPIDGETAYLATNMGLFLSRDSGVSWSRIDLEASIGPENFAKLKQLKQAPNPSGLGRPIYVN